MIILSGCSRQQRIEVRTEYVLLGVNETYLRPVELPTNPVTYKEYVGYKFQCDNVVATCNGRLEDIKNEQERSRKRLSTSE